MATRRARREKVARTQVSRTVEERNLKEKRNVRTNEEQII